MDESPQPDPFAFAKDFRLRETGVKGFFSHVSVGVGLDIGYERWRSHQRRGQPERTAPQRAGGAGVLLGVYDNTDDLRINFG
jgi:hypothetical protein